MQILNRPYYIGLGNHDIENNQGGSYHDNFFKCSLDMLYKFKNMLKKYNMKAVFAGHYHNSVGPQYSYSNYFGNIPVYLSGSSSQKKYLITEYTEKEMKIYTVTNDDWKNTKKLTSTILFK